MNRYTNDGKPIKIEYGREEIDEIDGLSLTSNILSNSDYLEQLRNIMNAYQKFMEAMHKNNENVGKSTLEIKMGEELIK